MCPGTEAGGRVPGDAWWWKWRRIAGWVGVCARLAAAAVRNVPIGGRLGCSDFCRLCLGKSRMCPIFNAFVTAATSCAQYEQAWPNCNCLNADINGDGMVSQADINPFVTLLSGGGNSGLSQTYVWDAENRLVE